MGAERRTAAVTEGFGGTRPRLAVVSSVLPFPRTSGQAQRVHYTLQAARERFEVAYVTVAPKDQTDEVSRRLREFCDESVVLPSLWPGQGREAPLRRLRGAAYVARTGLKPSNYVIGRVELSPERLRGVLETRRFDCALFEYWHASESVRVFRDKGIPCVLDMHNILWRSYARQLEALRMVPAWLRRWAVERYRRREEEAWRRFDRVIAINREEERYAAETLQPGRVFYAPMGVELRAWPYSWAPAEPKRVAYYGGLGGAQNVRTALRCAQAIMPEIWKSQPAAELWLVGSNPPEELRRLAADSRIKVTGFVENVRELLRTMSVVLCPWSGRYGFRSRVVELLALGVPAVATADAVDGMELEPGQGIRVAEGDVGLARAALELLGDARLARATSAAGRRRVEELFDFDHTYGRLMREITSWLRTAKEVAA